LERLENVNRSSTLPLVYTIQKDIAGWAALILALASWMIFSGPAYGETTPVSGGIRFEISFAESARPEPVTGRVYVAISRELGRWGGPIQMTGETGVPLFGKNIENIEPGQVVVIDRAVFGHPVACVDEIPSGEYWVQGFVNVYTRFERADGHTVWLHMDQWEGQRWKRSPGNLFSKPERVVIDHEAGGTFKILCDQVIPPIELPKDTKDVKRIRFKSKILTKWWGHPICLGATVRLPEGYEEHPDVHYPVNYIQGHFSRRAPRGSGPEDALNEAWPDGDIPRFIHVTLQHPSPYYDDSYGVNSQNNGPFGDAIMQELIPAVEERFRIIRAPWARKLSGGSTGGWIALAHQVIYPDFYGGCWASCPDPVDFRGYQIVNIYEDVNAYWLERNWMKIERPNRRRPDGNVYSMMKDENWYELAAGDRSRSGGQWDIWEATYSTAGPDGYPMRIWDKRTGEVHHDVAAYWKENYDLRHILERDWKKIGPELVGKIHIYTGDMDSFYLNNAVHMMHEFLESTKAPYYQGEVLFKPLAPHCWGPRGIELLKHMTRHIEKYAPPEADLASWRYR
jgi:hypothetical protein